MKVLVTGATGDVGRHVTDRLLADRMAVLGMELQEKGTADYVQFMKSDLERYRTLVRELGLRK